jgi:hypothetical protein
MHSVSSILNGMDYAPPGIALRGFFYLAVGWGGGLTITNIAPCRVGFWQAPVQWRSSCLM